MPPSWGADLLLHPHRRPLEGPPQIAAQEVTLQTDVTLKGWLFRTDRPRRGLVVYLHGVADNRGAGPFLAPHFTARGFDVLAYDSRAHGQSGGDACTYGFYEKQDLKGAIDQIGGGPVILFGSSMGAAVALQEAAGDPRVVGVIAVSTFSDLRTAVNERAPFFASQANIDAALRLAEARAHFSVDDVSPVRAAARIRVPVLLIHGEQDTETPPAHSLRVRDALAGSKKLVMVPGAGHNHVMKPPGVWSAVDAWIQSLVRIPAP